MSGDERAVGVAVTCATVAALAFRAVTWRFGHQIGQALALAARLALAVGVTCAGVWAWRLAVDGWRWRQLSHAMRPRRTNPGPTNRPNNLRGR